MGKCVGDKLWWNNTGTKCIYGFVNDLFPTEISRTVGEYEGEKLSKNVQAVIVG